MIMNIYGWCCCCSYFFLLYFSFTFIFIICLLFSLTITLYNTINRKKIRVYDIHTQRTCAACKSVVMWISWCGRSVCCFSVCFCFFFRHSSPFFFLSRCYFTRNMFAIAFQYVWRLWNSNSIRIWIWWNKYAMCFVYAA